MINSLKFENFRVFPELEIAPLKRINLIAGANNTGKTGVLEGLYLLFANGAAEAAILPSVFRSSISTQPGQVPYDNFGVFWQTLFYDKRTERSAHISAGSGSPSARMCSLSASESGTIDISQQEFPTSGTLVAKPGVAVQSSTGPFSVRINWKGVAQSGVPNPGAKKTIVQSTQFGHPSQDGEIFNEVKLKKGCSEALLTLLKEIDPRLVSLEYAKPPGTSAPLVYAHFGLENALCINQAGQGFSRLFSLFSQMLVSNAQVLLIDEIENGLYYQTLPQIWKGIAALAVSENIQVFATTHSRECILAAHETMKTMPEYDFALHRLQRVKGKLEAVTHDRGMLEASIRHEMEVR